MEILEILNEAPEATHSEVIAYLMPEFAEAVISDMNLLQDGGHIRRGKNNLII
jgi:hypothetical protein